MRLKEKAKFLKLLKKTIKLRVVSVKVESVEDVIFYGGKVTTEPQYEKTYNKKLAEKLDNEVYGVLRDAFGQVILSN